jgi:ribonucleoside-triphosphate reductase (formate)
MGIHLPVRDYFAGMGQAVADRTVNRKIGDRVETWAEVADRVALGNSLLEPREDLRSSEYARMNKRLREASLLMSGRHLQHGDETQPTRNMEVFTNCSTAATSFLLFYLLLNGSGVGRAYDDDLMVVDWANDMPQIDVVIDADYPDRALEDFPNVLSPGDLLYLSEETIYHMVEDSREGWAKVFELIEIHTYFGTKKRLIFDFSKVRKKGSPIKGMQNRPSSGPGPTMAAILKIREIRGSGIAPWKATMMIDHYCAESVVVGGARRAARMATKRWSDDTIFEFIRFKREGGFWSSNNSVTIDKEFRDACIKVRQFALVKGMELDALVNIGILTADELHAWKVLNALAEASYHDGTGEPGIINQDRLHANNEGLEVFKAGNFARSEKFQLDELTLGLMQDLAKLVIKAPFTMITNPCGEIALLMLGGYCVIADVVPFHAETDGDAEDAFRVAVRALIRTNLMNSIYGEEVKRTNRIGVGITGFHEWAKARFGFGWHDIIDEYKSMELWQLLAYFKRAIVDEAERYSKELGVVVPHTNTTFKPAGTTSKLFGLTEGAHLPSMREFVRWVQFRDDDPLIEDYRKRGYPTRTLTSYKNTVIVGFPTRPAICSLGENSDWIVTAAEATPEEQYQFLRLLEKYWIVGVSEDGVTPLENTGNQVSYTLKYDPQKVSFEHFLATLIDGQFSIRCCSVMPQIDATAYEYQPEEPVTREEFDAISAAIKHDVDEPKEDIGFEHVDCGVGGCPIDFSEEKVA